MNFLKIDTYSGFPGATRSLTDAKIAGADLLQDTIIGYGLDEPGRQWIVAGDFNDPPADSTAAQALQHAGARGREAPPQQRRRLQPEAQEDPK